MAMWSDIFTSPGRSKSRSKVGIAVDSESHTLDSLSDRDALCANPSGIDKVAANDRPLRGRQLAPQAAATFPAPPRNRCSAAVSPEAPIEKVEGQGERGRDRPRSVGSTRSAKVIPLMLEAPSHVSPSPISHARRLAKGFSSPSLAQAGQRSAVLLGAAAGGLARGFSRLVEAAAKATSLPTYDFSASSGSERDEDEEGSVKHHRQRKRETNGSVSSADRDRVDRSTGKGRSSRPSTVDDNGVGDGRVEASWRRHEGRMGSDDEGEGGRGGDAGLTSAGSSHDDHNVHRDASRGSPPAGMPTSLSSGRVMSSKSVYVPVSPARGRGWDKEVEDLGRNARAKAQARVRSAKEARAVATALSHTSIALSPSWGASNTPKAGLARASALRWNSEQPPSPPASPPFYAASPAAIAEVDPAVARRLCRACASAGPRAHDVLLEACAVGHEECVRLMLGIAQIPPEVTPASFSFSSPSLLGEGVVGIGSTGGNRLTREGQNKAGAFRHADGPRARQVAPALRSHATPLDSGAPAHTCTSELLHMCDALGRTALHVAAASGYVAAMQACLEAGADTRVSDGHGYTALHSAAGADSDECCLALLDANYDLLESGCVGDGSTALHVASRSGATKAMLALLQSAANATSVDSAGQTPLHVAFSGPAASLLLEHGAALHRASAHGWQAVHMAAAYAADVEVLSTLLGAADDIIDARTVDGAEYTPLHAAAGTGNTDAMSVLLLAGADASLVDSSGCTAVSLARSLGQGRAVAVLEAAASASTVLQRKGSRLGHRYGREQGPVALPVWGEGKGSGSPLSPLGIWGKGDASDVAEPCVEEEDRAAAAALAPLTLTAARREARQRAEADDRARAAAEVAAASSAAAAARAKARDVERDKAVAQAQAAVEAEARRLAEENEKHVAETLAMEAEARALAHAEAQAKAEADAAALVLARAWEDAASSLVKATAGREETQARAHAEEERRRQEDEDRFAAAAQERERGKERDTKAAFAAKEEAEAQAEAAAEAEALAHAERILCAASDRQTAATSLSQEQEDLDASLLLLDRSPLKAPQASPGIGLSSVSIPTPIPADSGCAEEAFSVPALPIGLLALPALETAGQLDSAAAVRWQALLGPGIPFLAGIPPSPSAMSSPVLAHAQATRAQSVGRKGSGTSLSMSSTPGLWDMPVRGPLSPGGVGGRQAVGLEPTSSAGWGTGGVSVGEDRDALTGFLDGPGSSSGSAKRPASVQCGSGGSRTEVADIASRTLLAAMSSSQAQQQQQQEDGEGGRHLLSPPRRLPGRPISAAAHKILLSPQAQAYAQGQAHAGGGRPASRGLPLQRPQSLADSVAPLRGPTSALAAPAAPSSSILAPDGCGHTLLLAPRCLTSLDTERATNPGSVPTFIEEHPVLSTGTGSTSNSIPPMGKPRRRRMVQDYEAMVVAYKAQAVYRAAAKGTLPGGKPLTCISCHEGDVRTAFLPCAHAAVCDTCLGGRGQGGWDMCPVCLALVVATVAVGATNDSAVQARVEAALTAAMTGGLHTLGGVAGTACPPRFRTLFARSGRALEDWVQQGKARKRIAAKLAGAGGSASAMPSLSVSSFGPPTSSDLARAGWKPDFGPESALATGDAKGLLASEPGGAWYSDFEEG